MSRYSEKIKRLKVMQNILIVLCVAAMIGFFYFLFKPQITRYDVKDECGPIGGAISHSIDDVDSCKNACGAYCLSLQQEIYDSEFTENIEGCHICRCYCKS